MSPIARFSGGKLCCYCAVKKAPAAAPRAGGGAGQTAFGTKTGDVLTLVTIAIFILFLVTAIVLNFAARPSSAPPPGTAIRELGEDAPVVGDEPVGEEPPEQNSDAPVNDLIQPEDQTTTEDAPSGDEDGGTP